MCILLWTFHVDSNCYYGGTIYNPFQGLYQGNLSALDLWIFMISVLVLYFRYEVHTIKFHSPLNGLLLSIAELIFVYDSDLLTIDPNNSPEMHLVFPPMKVSLDTF